MIYNVYTISIGNANVVYLDDLLRGEVTIGIDSKRNEDCIELGFHDTTSKNNTKKISTNNFSKLLVQSTQEVYDLFMSENGFFKQPDVSRCYPLNTTHLQVINDAIEQWENEHLGCEGKIPYRGEEPEGFESLTIKEQFDIAMEYDWVYANLLWLQFWIGESLNEDDYPSILIKPLML